MGNKFIAISEEEYNSFKHGEYIRKIGDLEEKIYKLEEEKLSIARSRAVVIEHSNLFTSPSYKIKILSEDTFENEMLEYLRNKDILHGVKFALNGDGVEFVEIGDKIFYRNKYSLRLRDELSDLCLEISRKKKEVEELNSQISILKSIVGKEVEEEETPEETETRKFNHFGDGFIRALKRKLKREKK